MKKSQGITLISLVVTVVIMIIISSVSIQVSVRVYNDAKVENYITKLKVVQSKVDNLVEETDDVSSYEFIPLTTIEAIDANAFTIFTDVIANPQKYNINSSWNEESDKKIENYYYFDKDELEKLGLKNQDITVAINFETRNVIAKESLKLNGKVYHRQYDLSGGEKLDFTGEDNPITLASQIQPRNYGDKINYSVTVDGTELSDWKVFYKNDSGEIYIILSEYLNSTLVPSVTGMTNDGKYSAWWENVADHKSAVATLTNNNYWSQFASGVGGKSATGAPTLEMWVNSWNAKGYNPLYTKEDTNGYLIDTKTDVTNYSITLGDYDTSGFNDALYFPTHNSKNGCWGYWLASPSMKKSSSETTFLRLMRVNCAGGLGNGALSDNDNINGFALGVRPVVCLKLGVEGSYNVTEQRWVINNKYQIEE